MAAGKVDASLRLVKNQREMKKKIESPLAKYPFLHLFPDVVKMQAKLQKTQPLKYIKHVFFILQPALAVE